jgi:hypothetical protein
MDPKGKGKHLKFNRFESFHGGKDDQESVEKGGARMKRLISFVLLAALALPISACAGVGKQETSRVKCPACGYEFDAPRE